MRARACREVFTQPRVSVHTGEQLLLLRVGAQEGERDEGGGDGNGFCWVRTGSGTEGFLNSHYLGPWVL